MMHGKDVVLPGVYGRYVFDKFIHSFIAQIFIEFLLCKGLEICH